MLETITELLKSIDDVVWGWPLILLILATGILLTLRMGFLQIRYLPKALKFMVKNEEGGTGEVSSFGALCTAMSATVGTGNIVGVATAIMEGGPGALFWMWLAALFGMATKYAEGFLAIKYRMIDGSGHVLGGPFYYIERGMGKNWKWMAVLFAVFGAGAGLLGIGTITQVNGIAEATKNFFDPDSVHMVELFGGSYSVTTLVTAVVVTLAAGLVILGGIKRISGVSEIVVPFMAIAYVATAVIILVTHAGNIPGAIREIFRSAFALDAVLGGAMGTLIIAVQKGVARGIFSNEAGLGSAPIAAAAASTKNAVRQGLVTMTGTFIDTIVICTMTGLVILVTGAHHLGLEGVAVTTAAFQQGLPFSSRIAAGLLMMCLAFFAFTTILGWDYYGERCIEYIFAGRRMPVMVYRILYVLAVFAGPFLTVKFVWTLADIFNALMAFPNLIALAALSGVVVAETKRGLRTLK